ncbi:putative acetyltransferase [uncultured phage_MedDCM-OCT-S28-C10]|uniref:Putative acetyltransferase n=1 Tax=uncultured phage_MedDCM-OCT-S28-C10 TaxID=2741077 RepID=A0A6S4PCK3_9CAUD|nr:internal virion protein [uncultured phage_MedDCM-OCT-S28-C10]BAQ94047.1 putative acetyltransferase [uncultured phage_MedDCM-OCT-S28-C10]BAR25249.1 putative acetyltransferase [uncultured Mediterranean phage uvMED]BAR25340.1 putative acetyltransferase [uncultured Mediterranean phage uvMED]
MSKIPTVRKAKITDAVSLSKNLKALDKLEIKYSHDDEPIDALMSCFDQQSAENFSIVAHDGEIYGMFGVNDDPELEGYGVVWLLSSSKLQKFPISFFKESKKWIEKLHTKYDYIYNFVYEKNWQSLKWLQLCGFKPIASKKIGKYNKKFILIMRSKEQYV